MSRTHRRRVLEHLENSVCIFLLDRSTRNFLRLKKPVSVTLSRFDFEVAERYPEFFVLGVGLMRSNREASSAKLIDEVSEFHGVGVLEHLDL